MMFEYRSGPGSREAPCCTRALIAGTVLALAVSGCSFAIPSLVTEPPEEVTGSVAPRLEPKILSSELGQEDWRRAKAALVVALDPQGNGQPVKWDNPDTKLRGEITPTSKPFVEDDHVCRRFTATTVSRTGDVSVRDGSACKLSGDEWELRKLAPLKS